MDKNSEEKGVVLNKETVDILVTNIIPTTKYFERSFEVLKEQLKDQKEELRYFKKDVDKRFEQVDNTIAEFKKDVDKRFEQVDKRFEQVDKRFEQVNDSIAKLTVSIEKQNSTIRDLIMNRDKEYDRKFEELTKHFMNRDKEYDRKLEELTKYFINRDRDYDRKFENHRRYFIAILGLFLAILLKTFGIIELPNHNTDKMDNTKQSKTINNHQIQ